MANAEAGEAPYSRSQMAYEQVLAAIIDGRYPVNSKLPAEIALSRQVGVSRPVLRAALVRLRADGVLRSRQGSGNYVVRQPHRTVLRLAGLENIADVQNCFKFRIGIEGEAAYYAAENIQPETLAPIDAALQQLETAARSDEAGVDPDFAFHMAIAEASRNPYFISSLAAIKEHMVFGITITHHLSLRRPRARLLEVQAEHLAIRDAIARQDPEAARETMRTHLANARGRLFEGDLNDEAPGAKA
jgi:GntR family transcriptional repressor for pyruvate dehydrogenase complex